MTYILATLIALLLCVIGYLLNKVYAIKLDKPSSEAEERDLSLKNTWNKFDELLTSLLTIHEIGIVNAGSIKKEEFFQTVVDSACDLIHSPRGSLMVFDEASKELKDFSNIDFKHADIEKISFSPEEKFDVIILVFLAHHLKNISPVIEKLKSCLTHHGQIIILDHLDAEKKDRYLFYREIIKKYGLLKFFQMFYFGTFSNTLLKQHLLREKRMTRADFQRKFEALLPGADLRIVNGIFVILEWRRQSGPTLTNAVVLF